MDIKTEYPSIKSDELPEVKITLTLIYIKKKSRNVMRKLLLIVLIFLIIGAVSAHEDFNGTADSLLKDTEYNSQIDDDDEPLVVEENDDIPVEVHAEEPWSLKVHIDRKDSPVNDDYVNVTYNHVDIPTSVIVNDEETPLGLGKHDIVYEFTFTNTTSVYKPEAYISDSGVYFDFKYIRSLKNPQNSIYRFTSQFNIVKSTDPILKTIDVDDISITHSDSLSFYLKGIGSGKATVYLDDEYFSSLEIDENPYEEEIDTKKLAVGSYNLICIVETDKAYAEYNINADTSNSMLNVNFIKSKTVSSPNRYIVTIKTTLNVREIPEVNPIYINGPSIDINYTRSIPVRFEGEDSGNLAVYIDGIKVYENSIMLTWENVCYIPTKDGNGNYFGEGSHDLSFEFVMSDKYSRYNPEVSKYNNILTFNFQDSQESGSYLNDKFIINSKLNIINDNKQVIPIDSQAVVRIVHTNDINLEIDGMDNAYDLTVFVDDVEIYDGHTAEEAISIKTFYERSSIEDTNERDIQTGTHSIRFEFSSPYTYDAEAEFENNAMHFKFNKKDSATNSNAVRYQLNTSLIVSEKQKTVHILKVKNNTYFDDTEFVVKMDLYKPESGADWDDDDDYENPIGLQDVGIIVSDSSGIVYVGDSLMNVYAHQQWNYEFENENLPKAGTYTIKIINLADNTYDTATFVVKKANRMFSKKYSSDDFNVLFTLDFSSCREDLNSPLTITLDNKKKVINVKKGLPKSKERVIFEDIDPGTYTATFTLKGNDIYNDVTLKSKVTVKKEAPTISYSKNGGNGLDVTIDIGKSKTSAVLIVSAGGEKKTFTVDKNTKHITARFNNLASGSYNVEIEFKGNERYTSKTLSTTIDITQYSSPHEASEPSGDNRKPGHGFGNNTGGIGTGSGNSNVTGSGNGTVNGRLSLNGKGLSGDLGSQGSGHGDGAKSYEITKNIKKIDENAYSLLIFLICALILLFLSFIYERRENDESEEY